MCGFVPKVKIFYKSELCEVSKCNTLLQYPITKRTFYIYSVPSARVTEICPDCSTFIDFGNEQVQKAVSQSLEKFNNESGLNNHFALLKILRASAGVSKKNKNKVIPNKHRIVYYFIPSYCVF